MLLNQLFVQLYFAKILHIKLFNSYQKYSFCLVGSKIMCIVEYFKIVNV
jgi:hypothetical protein